jgi:putative addiction module component (TIGR02574 family)
VADASGDEGEGSVGVSAGGVEFLRTGPGDAMSSVEELAQKARALPREDSARLVEDLLASLHEARDPEIEAAWDEEIRRRVEEIESGKAKLIPADEVFDEIRKMLK